MCLGDFLKGPLPEQFKKFYLVDMKAPMMFGFNFYLWTIIGAMVALPLLMLVMRKPDVPEDMKEQPLAGDVEAAQES